jgi:hypothetical protein
VWIKTGGICMKVTDLTIDELKKFIREAVDEKFKEILFDPDNGLELRDEVEQRLKVSLASKERISLEEVKERLRL